MAAPIGIGDADILCIGKIAHLLTSVPHVVALILSNFKAKDLNRCAAVCKFWARIVGNVKKKRKTRSWTLIRYTDGEEYFGGEDDINVIAIRLKDYFQNLYTEPHVVFMFCNYSLYEVPIRTIKRTQLRGRVRVEYLQVTIDEYIRTLLPQECQLVAASGGGLIGTSSDLTQISEMEDRSAMIQGVTFLCLPNYEGAKIVSCDTDFDDYVPSDNPDEYEIESREKMKYIPPRLTESGMCREIPEDMPCVAMLMLWTSVHFRFRLLILSEVVKKYPETLVSGGEVIELMQRDKTCGYYFPHIKCTAICGTNVRAASVVIDDAVNTSAQVEERLQTLKSHNLPEDNSFAFMLSSERRGEDHYGFTDVESTVFQKYFPKTPLFGYFSEGQCPKTFGFDFVSGEAETDENSKKRQKMTPPKMAHTNATVFVLVSITSNM